MAPVSSIERFVDIYMMVTSGVPAMVEHRAAASTTGCNSVAMDLLELNMVAVDHVFPLSDLSTSLNKLSILPSDFEEDGDERVA
ncbi:hypothetical protein RND81_10G032500 [Saponaria officinalis]|uniref:VPS28 C-terminal domain-containing protein n=1 Tax=Saponaria officinalis TaxID=3572 RepID=A0AAW1HYK5_SAPOF